METEVYVKTTNNNPTPQKRWSGAGVLGAVEEDESPPPSERGRRKSWHFSKENKRARRKNSLLPPSSNRQKEKRPSWWNIFVPDQLGPSKSRRQSQDIPTGGGRRASEVLVPTIPFLRNKSRSVDHGTSVPFDLQALRSKVEDRFQSLDKLSRTDTDGESGSRESLVERKMQPSIPVKTTDYKVEATDSLTSIAARFDTTPSELVKLNRLSARTVFPGQVIRVPDKSGRKERSGSHVASGGHDGDDDVTGDRMSQTTSTERSDNTDEEDMLDSLRVNSPKPGHVERVGTPSSPLLEKFLRINVKHVTDGQGVVSGVLIVTPNALMFDPNVSDTLVIEHGAESYGVIAPMDYVVNAAIYHDIAHMRVGNAENSCSNLPKPEVYHMKSEESEGEAENSCMLSTDQGDSRELSTKDTLPELRSSTEEDDALWMNGTQREGDAFPKAFERDLVTPTNSNLDKLSDNQDTTIEDKSPVEDEEEEDEENDKIDPEALVKATEERRRSCLDHHWAVPKQSVDSEREDLVEEAEGFQPVDEGRRDSEGHLVKLSCHDSGIDIRDPPPPAPVQRKTVYSDADILLAGDGEFLPPVPVQPLPPAPSSDEEKKKQTVSFSLDDELKKEEDKHEPKKTKMLKRLSYPLSWVEGITGSEDKGLPSSADSQTSSSHTPSSVFSKVFSSPINMVTDFGSGLFMKTPSEDGSKFQFPPIPDSQPSSAPSSAPMFSPSNFISSVGGRPSVGTTYMKPKLDYRSMVSVEDMPELFAPFDKLIPRPARSCEDPPLYLRLRMGKPKDKKIPRSTTIMSYGKKKMRPEYWFSVPRERVDDLYKFLTTWVGHLYGELDEEAIAARGYELIDSDTELFEPDDRDGLARRGSDGDNEISLAAKESWEPQAFPREFPMNLDSPLHKRRINLYQLEFDRLLTIGRRIADKLDAEEKSLATQWFKRLSLYSSRNKFIQANRNQVLFSLVDALRGDFYNKILTTEVGKTFSRSEKEELKVLSMSGELRRALYATSAASLDLELFLPDLVGATEILTEDHRKQLCRHLPARAEGYVWTLVFSTSQHGFSLNSMYRKMTRVESPILMVIEDTENNVFGALTSCALKVSDHFYGTGESLLFRFAPDIQVYNWTGENMYFIKGNNESLSIGAGDGKFGLWLDGDLNQGRSESCSTYGNEPLSPQQDFVIKALECWAFF